MTSGKSNGVTTPLATSKNRVDTFNLQVNGGGGGGTNLFMNMKFETNTFLSFYGKAVNHPSCRSVTGRA